MSLGRRPSGFVGCVVRAFKTASSGAAIVVGALDAVTVVKVQLEGAGT